MANPKFGSFEDLVEMTAKPLRSIVKRLRGLIMEIHPDAHEVVRLGDRAATYGLGPKKMSEGYVYILPYAKWVNLGFYRGVELDDPQGLLEGTGAIMRHVKLRSSGEAEQPVIRALITAAFNERRKALGR